MQLMDAQTERIQQLRKNLLLYTDELYAENHSEFEMHVRNVAAQKLATAEYGPVMLIVIGKVYRLQAKRFNGNIGAFFKCAPNVKRHGCRSVTQRNVTGDIETMSPNTSLRMSLTSSLQAETSEQILFAGSKATRSVRP